MGWSRRSSNPDENDPLGANLGPNRPDRHNDATQPLDADNDPGIHNQETVIDNNFSSRSQTRRQRQMRSPFNTQRLGTWAANPDSSRKLLAVGAAIVIMLVLITIIRLASDGSDTTANTGAPLASAAPAFNDPALASATAAASGSAPAFEFQTAQAVPNTNPAQASAAATTGAFVVTGTETEGLFLRSAPVSDPANILATLPEGTRVQATGNTQNDGTREWREVTSDFGTGWAASDFLQPAP